MDFKNGMLDEFYLYDRVISDSEIEKSWQALQKQTDSDAGNFFTFCPYPELFLPRNKLSRKKKFGDQRQRLTEIMVMKEMPGERETHILGAWTLRKPWKSCKAGDPKRF